MGAQSSSLNELNENSYLKRLSGPEIITANDPFWNQLLSFSFQIPVTVGDMKLLEDSTAAICRNLAINNCRTGNFGALVRVFIRRSTELKASAQTEDNIFVWQTYNALFIIRNICKYFIENLSEEVVIKEFETLPKPEGEDEPSNYTNLLDEFICHLVELVVDVPVLAFTYALHMEAMNSMIVLFASQMFTSLPAAESAIYQYIMQGKSSIHACILTKTLLQNFISQVKCPPQLMKNRGGSALYNMTAAVASGLWTAFTLGLAKSAEEEEEEIPETLLANQSLLILLILTNHCTSERHIHNPYREALFNFTDSEDTSNSNPTEAVATFKLEFSKLYDTLCQTLKDDQTTLLLYLLLHRNTQMKSFILSRTNMDNIVMPVLKILYHAQEKNSHHIYMALILILIFSEDEVFNSGVHELTQKNVLWFKERQISEISLGSLMILVIIRTIQYNMTRMRDKYLHTNCLAALANMSAQFRNVHPYVAQRIINLFAQLSKKHNKLLDQIQIAATDRKNQDESDVEFEQYEQELVSDLSVLEEVIRMVLEIINSCLTHSIHHNPHLIYTLLYKKEVFSQFRTHPNFQDLLQNIDLVLGFFTNRLEQYDKSPSVHAVMEVIEQGSKQFKRERLKKFPELKFKYVEEDSPEEFFIPYVWSLVYHSANIYFNPDRVQLFTLSSTVNS